MEWFVNFLSWHHYEKMKFLIQVPQNEGLFYSIFIADLVGLIDLNLYQRFDPVLLNPF